MVLGLSAVLGMPRRLRPVVAGLALLIDRATRSIRVALGAVGPTVIRAHDAERFAAGQIDWDGAGTVEAATYDEFGRRAATAAAPIDDHRSTADYRRHAVGVMARRALERATSGWEAR